MSSLMNRIRLGELLEHHPCYVRFAENLRRLFLVVGGIHFLQPCAAVSLGGMEGQASTDTPMQPTDPWQVDDPWKPKKKSAKQS